MLDVPRNATQAEIDASFAKVTAKLDATTSVRGTAASMNELNVIREGYKILSDPEKRVMYDAKLHATEHGITLMFFPKDTKAVKKLGVETLVFALLACVFTYVVYQKLMRGADPVRVEQEMAAKKNAPAQSTQIAPAQSKAATPAEPPANPPDAKATAKPDEKK